MGLSFFFTIDGSIPEKILKILCLICWGLGGCVYLYGVYEAIFSTILFPEGTRLITSNWLMHIGLRFFVLWVPMGFALIQWQMKRPLVVPVLYILGCLVAIFLSIIALILILDYIESNKLMEEYIEIIQEQLRNNKEFPPYILRVLNAYGCCGWHDPTDFAPSMVFDINGKVNTDATFMKEVSKCYGKAFEVSARSAGGVHYSPAARGLQERIPMGCQKMFTDTAERQINFIGCMAIIVILFSLMILLLYVINYMKMPSAQVGPVNAQRNGIELEDLQQDPRSSVDNVEDPRQFQGPSDAPSNVSQE